MDSRIAGADTWTAGAHTEWGLVTLARRWGWVLQEEGATGKFATAYCVCVCRVRDVIVFVCRRRVGDDV